MLSLMFKGKVVERKAITAENSTVCACVVVEVSGYSLGNQRKGVVMCWLPSGLSRRKEFLLKEENKYFTIRADWIFGIDPERKSTLKADYEVTIAEIDF